MKKKYSYPVIYEAAEEGGYIAYVPSLPGCHSQGDTLEEAEVNITEAIELYLEPIEDDLIISKDVIIKEINL